MWVQDGTMIELFSSRISKQELITLPFSVLTYSFLKIQCWLDPTVSQKTNTCELTMILHIKIKSGKSNLILVYKRQNTDIMRQDTILMVINLLSELIQGFLKWIFTKIERLHLQKCLSH